MLGYWCWKLHALVLFVGFWLLVENLMPGAGKLFMGVRNFITDVGNLVMGVECYFLWVFFGYLCAYGFMCMFLS